MFIPRWPCALMAGGGLTKKRRAQLQSYFVLSVQLLTAMNE